MAGQPKYRITDKIDAGGMAEVFRGVSESSVGNIRKPVAIKRILPSLTKNKKFIQMFLDEARLSMNLQHANVVSVFDIGVADTTYFIVMEHVDGGNLKSLVEWMKKQGKRMPVAHAVYIIMEVCKGLQYAHDLSDPETGEPLSIVHRDISPPNVLISRRGEVKLVDFGLAKASSQLESTDPGVVKGKFSYLSPEAASGKEVDPRTDIFAVGIVLYELLTGKRLFFGESDYQTVELVRQAKVPRIDAQNPEVDAELDTIIRKALAKDVNARYQTAGDFQEALAQHLFSRGLKVTSRDIAQLVQSMVADKEKQKAGKPAGDLIDTLLNEEIVKFTSIDDVGMSDPSLPGTSPIPQPPVGSQPLDSTIDTRDWAGDLGDAGRNTGQRPAYTPPKETSDVRGLEEVLEGDQHDPTATVPNPPPKKPSSNTGVIVAVVFALVAAAGAALLFLK